MPYMVFQELMRNILGLFIAPPIAKDFSQFGYTLEDSVKRSKDFGIHYKTKAKELEIPF